MSGISEIQKKAKLSMDELYEHPSNNKKQVPTPKKQDIKQTNKLDIQTSSKPDIQPANQQAGSILKPKHLQTMPTTPSAPVNTEAQNTPSEQASKYLLATPPHKLPTYKMTFILTEDSYKAFNDLYAKRMLKGCKTEKSEMICEAIDWLVKMEDN